MNPLLSRKKKKHTNPLEMKASEKKKKVKSSKYSFVLTLIKKHIGTPSVKEFKVSARFRLKLWQEMPKSRRHSLIIIKTDSQH